MYTIKTKFYPSNAEVYLKQKDLTMSIFRDSFETLNEEEAVWYIQDLAEERYDVALTAEEMAEIVYEMECHEWIKA